MKSAPFALKRTQIRSFMRAMKTGSSPACVALAFAVSFLCMAGAEAADTAAVAQPAAAAVLPSVPSEQDAPYDRDLLRLSEIIGSVHYLRGLCKPGMDDPSRLQMERLLDLEAAKEPLRRQRLTAAFNRGYRSFAALHATCTASARAAEARYRAEGATLAAEMTARFGN